MQRYQAFAMGHADPGFTLRTYTQAMDPMQIQAAETMGLFMSQNLYETKPSGMKQKLLYALFNNRKSCPVCYMV